MRRVRDRVAQSSISRVVTPVRKESTVARGNFREMLRGFRMKAPCLGRNGSVVRLKPDTTTAGLTTNDWRLPTVVPVRGYAKESSVENVEFVGIAA